MSECSKIEKLLKSYLNSSVSRDEIESIEKHTASCEVCRERYEAVKNADEILDSHTPKEDDALSGFDESFHLKLVELNEKLKVREKPSLFKSKRRLFFLFGTAFAIFLLFTVAYVANSNSENHSPMLISKSVVKAGKPFTIKLKYHSERDIKNVNVNVFLEKGVAFYSQNPEIKSLRQYKWTGDLKRGLNEIPFVITVEKIGVWDIDTVAEFQGFTHSHRITLTADDERVAIAYYSFPKKKIVNEL